MSKDRLGQKERDEPVFPKPRMKLSDGLILGPNPLNRVRLLPPNDNPLTTVELASRSGCRQGVVMWRSCLLQMVLKLSSAENTGQRRWGRPRQSRHQRQTWWNQREQSRHACSTWWCLDDDFAQVALGIQALMALLGEKLSGSSLIS